MVTNALVSVVMPCYRMGAYVRDALSSVDAQTYPRWELIAVDDCGPADGTREAVQAFIANHPDRRVEYIRHEVNGGVGAARNTAIAAARGEFVAFLDPDDVWFPEHLATALREFSRLGFR